MIFEVFIFNISLFLKLQVTVCIRIVADSETRIFQVTTEFYADYNAHIYYYFGYYFYTLLATGFYILILNFSESSFSNSISFSSTISVVNSNSFIFSLLPVIVIRPLLVGMEIRRLLVKCELGLVW